MIFQIATLEYVIYCSVVTGCDSMLDSVNCLRQIRGRYSLRWVVLQSNASIDTRIFATSVFALVLVVHNEAEV